MKERKTALYCRVSNEEQVRNGESISDQLLALRAYSREHGCGETVEFLDEGYSARKSYKTRPALRELLAAVERDEIGLILFVRLDRWFRNLKDYYKVQDILDRHKVEWNAIAEGYTTTTAQGRLMLNLKLSIAEHEADLTSERIKWTFAQKRARGEIISGGMPWGYKLVDHKPVKDESCEAACNAFWRTYLKAGRVHDAIRAANALGATLNISHVGNMLRNAKHYGGMIQNCPCDGYLTAEEQAFVQSTRTHRVRPTNTVYMFTGFVWCGTCGHRYSAHRCKFPLRAGQTEEDRRFYNSYFCSHRINTVKAGCDNSVNINEKKIEAALLAGLDSAFADRVGELQSALQPKKKSRDDKATEKKIATLEARKRRGWEAYLDGIVSKADFETERAKIDEQLAELIPAEDEKKITPEQARAILPENWREVYDQLDREHRRQFWFQVIGKITIYPDRSVGFTLSF